MEVTMKLSELKNLVKIDSSIRVEVLRRTWLHYVVRVVSRDSKGKKHADLLTGLWNNILSFNSIEEVKDYLNAVKDLESFYIRHMSPHAEVSGLNDKIVSQKSSQGGVKIPLHKK